MRACMCARVCMHVFMKWPNECIICAILISAPSETHICILVESAARQGMVAFIWHGPFLTAVALGMNKTNLLLTRV